MKKIKAVVLMLVIVKDMLFQFKIVPYFIAFMHSYNFSMLTMVSDTVSICTSVNIAVLIVCTDNRCFNVGSFASSLVAHLALHSRHSHHPAPRYFVIFLLHEMVRYQISHNSTCFQIHLQMFFFLIITPDYCVCVM